MTLVAWLQGQCSCLYPQTFKNSLLGPPSFILKGTSYFPAGFLDVCSAALQDVKQQLSACGRACHSLRTMGMPSHCLTRWSQGKGRLRAGPRGSPPPFPSLHSLDCSCSAQLPWGGKDETSPREPVALQSKLLLFQVFIYLSCSFDSFWLQMAPG